MKVNRAAVATAAFAVGSHALLFHPNQPRQEVSAASATDLADLSAFLANVPTQPTDDKPDADAAAKAAKAAAQDDLPSDEEIDKLIASLDASAAATGTSAGADDAQVTDIPGYIGEDGQPISVDDLISAIAAEDGGALGGAASPTGIPQGPSAGAADAPAPGAASVAAASHTATPAFPGADIATSAVVPGVATPSHHGGRNGTSNDQQVWLAGAPRVAVSGLALAGVVAAYLL